MMSRETNLGVINYNLEKATDSQLEEISTLFSSLSSEEIVKGLNFQYGKKFRENLKAKRIHSYLSLTKSIIQRKGVKQAAQDMIFREERGDFSRTTRWRILKQLSTKYPELKIMYRMEKKKRKKYLKAEENAIIANWKQIGVLEYIQKNI